MNPRPESERSFIIDEKKAGFGLPQDCQIVARRGENEALNSRQKISEIWLPGSLKASEVGNVKTTTRPPATTQQRSRRLTSCRTCQVSLYQQLQYQAWRIYVFTQSKILIGFLVVAALATCGMGIAAAIQAWILHELAKLIALQPVVEANLALQCAIDVIIAVRLTVIFSRSKTSFGRTDKVLNRLIRTAVQSGFFTAVFALGTLFAFRFSPGTQMIALFSLPIGRIYTHTMMDSLITREQLRNLLSNGGNGNLVSFPQFAGAGETIMMRPNPSTTTAAKDPEAL
ncbi:hypothetical protein FB451DRAFT_1042867 [Mycena latifolia]|nr:hypothetical protein FB451DRAFT_1042867 [Mycena latifolia]